MIRKASVLLLAVVFAIGCASDPNRRAKQGAATGAVAGAVVGAIIGNQSGNNRTGAVIGAAAGAAIGGAVGHRMDQQQQELQQIPGVEVTRPSENQIDVRVTSDILFDTDSASLRSASRATLQQVAQNVAQYPDEVVDVEGHTDSTGSDDYNMGLSQRRADSVRGYLVDQGIPASRVTARG
ncbi:MAG: OmpA family protein, partial [Acidobacteria bacterium]|nr:OmpA family protein [Acidobacteriota bacterium]